MVAPEPVRRGDVFLISLDPARGDEIHKTRPCVIVSPDELNEHLRTFIVAPLTTGSHPYPFRLPCRFQDRRGHIVLDQIRTIDRERLVKRLGRLSPAILERVLAVLQEMFTPQPHQLFQGWQEEPGDHGVQGLDLSEMENSKRPIGKNMAQRLAQMLKTGYRVFL